MDIQQPKARTAGDTISTAAGPIKVDLIKVITASLNGVLKIYESSVSSMKQELVLIENDRLHMRQKSNKSYYSCRPFGAGKDIGISNDTNRVHRLARRAYLENRISAMELEIKRFQRKLYRADAAHYELNRSKMLKKYADADLDLLQILFTEEQREWIRASYFPNPYHPQTLKYSTSLNIPMRSKSEVAIGNALESVNWPYRYDDLVTITADSYGPQISSSRSGSQKMQPFRDTYFADFKIPNLLGGITIHEHFGAFQLDHYSDDALKRLNDYHSFTVTELPERPVKHSEFTWSFECDVSGTNSLTDLLAKLLLPGPGLF